MSKTILIGGGSGTIGSHLTALLLQKGYQVRHLGRRAKKSAVETFQWDIEKMTVDERAFEGVSLVINLAGANINGQRWTDEYKKELIESRTKSTQLIVDFLNKGRHQVEHFISGSAVGYYGFAPGSKVFKETDQPGTDFMSQLVVAWEAEAKKLDDSMVLSVVRTGIVLTREEGALKEMTKPIRMFAGAPLGSGEQVISWIHVDDLCAVFQYLIDKKLGGVFNGVAPHPATNKELTKIIAQRIGRPLILPNIPGFALRLILGEMAEAVINGARVSPRKLQDAGFVFAYPEPSGAVNDLLPAG